MTVESWVALVGGVAAVCTTGAFVPQIVKIWRQGGRDLSYGMLIFFLTGVALWLGYGLLTGARPVIVANAVTLFLVLFALGLKWRQERPGTAISGARRQRIAIDMDDVLADTLGKQMRLYNEAFGTSLTRADLGGRSFERAVPPEHAAAAHEMVLAPGFFRDLAVMPGSQEVVRTLTMHYDVVIASSAMEVPTSFADKFAWLNEHFAFIPASNIVFCGDKGKLKADYLIDDSPRHFAHFGGTPLLFSAPQNRDETRYLRVASWRDVQSVLVGPELLPLARIAARDLATTA